MDRRELLGLGVALGALGSATRAAAGNANPPPTGRYARCFEQLDRYVAQYMPEMNIPALTLSLADASGVQRVCDYGFEDLERRRPLEHGRLFHIGSISKSFLALCLMQLRDEGRFDPHSPVDECMPWFRVDGFDKAITCHDLMTHSAALPDGPPFPPDPAFRYRATAAAGSFFHYCNTGWTALGFLVEQLDGRALAESLRERIFRPLGMHSTAGAITLDIVPRTAVSYQPVYNDRPFPRNGALVRGAPIHYTEAAGCIASTAQDMGKYVQMLINRGAIGNQRLVSSEGFELFMHPHVAAEEFGTGAAYGYAIAIDKLDGHVRLSHTGGMVSFASALQVDLDAGVGVFASVNAMQGDRPSPPAEYALRLMRAAREGAAMPTLPAPSPALQVADAADFAGVYTGARDQVLTIIAERDRLFLMHQGARVPLEPSGDSADAFVVLHDDFAHYPLVFTRGSAKGKGVNKKGAVTEVAWGERWYAARGFQGVLEVPAPAEWSRYAGHYRTEDPWVGSVRLVLRRGRLWMNGVTPLEAAADGRFYLRDEPTSPEWMAFSDFVNGQPMLLHFSGYVLQRV